MNFEKSKKKLELINLWISNKYLFLFDWFKNIKNKDFSKIDANTFKKIMRFVSVCFIIFISYSFFQIYVPLNPNSNEIVTYTIQKGWGNNEIANELKNLGMIRSSYFFQLYTFFSFNHAGLQAGKYALSSNMSTYKIVKKMISGDTKKDRFVIYEGWSVEDIGKYLESRELCTKEEFKLLTEKNYELEFEFLAGRPTNANLEGYLFPDTYEIFEGQICEDIIKKMLINFGNKLSKEIQAEITSQNKTIFEIVTMASLLEKEVRSLEDKKIVSGILWKRLDAGMPLQLDATINYITGRNDSSVSIKNTKIDSPYNTYKYKGLPRGPISNPGMNAITAALEPTKTDYWFYLSSAGKTYFSKTFQEHSANKTMYLK